MIFLGDAFPVNVLNAVESVPDVCRICCATKNALQVVVGATEQGRGGLGVIDGQAARGVEDEGATNDRHACLRTIGYKR